MVSGQTRPMSGGVETRKKDEGSGARLIAGALIVASIAAGIGVFYQGRYDKSAADNTREYVEYANQEVAQACRGVPEIQLVDCFADARIKGELKKRDKQHDEAELVTQRKSALWTTIMGT